MIFNQVSDKAWRLRSVSRRLTVIWRLLQTKKAWWLPVVLMTIVGAVVRFRHLDTQSLWIDEYLWVLLGSKELTAIAHTTDGYPPAYGFLVHFLLRAGFDSDWWLRVPSAVAGTLAIPLVYYVGRQVEKHCSAAIAASLLAIHPLAVWYSQEASPYSLLMLCALLSTLCLLAILRGGGLRSALGYEIGRASCRERV